MSQYADGEDLKDFKNIKLVPGLWDDLRFPATAINPPGQASDPDVEAASGLLLFAATGTELVYLLAQMPHCWEEGTAVSPHVHWQKTTSASGDVMWQLSYKISAIGEVMDADWTTVTASSPVASTPDNDTANEHLLTSFTDIAMAGNTLSTCILFRLSRLGDDAADTYGADARLLEFDLHYQTDQPGGSRQEFVK